MNFNTDTYRTEGGKTTPSINSQITLCLYNYLSITQKSNKQQQNLINSPALVIQGGAR